MDPKDIFGTAGPNQNIFTDPTTGNKSFFDQQTIMGKPGWSQLGMTPEDFGFSSGGQAPQGAVQDQQYGWIAPTDQVNPVLLREHDKQEAKNKQFFGFGSGLADALKMMGMAIGVGAGGSALFGGTEAGGMSGAAGGAMDYPMFSGGGYMGNAAEAGVGASGGSAGGSLFGGGGGSANPFGQFGTTAKDIANLPTSGAVNSAVTTTASSGNPFMSVLDKINDVLGITKNPLTMGDIGKAGANYFLQNSLASKYAGAAEKAASLSDALSQPQRAQAQSMLSQLLANPSQFYATNPAVKGQLDQVRQQFEANTGKFGTGGFQFDNYLKNVANVLSGTYNDQAQLLAGIGGFNQGTGFTGNNYAGLAGKGLEQQMQQQYFFADLVKKIFNSQDQQNKAGLS